MKKRIIICLLILVSSNWIFGQSFESMVDSNKMWVVLIEGTDNPTNDTDGDSFAYKVQDSLLMSEKYWMKLWESSDSLYSKWEHKGYLNEKDSVVLYMDLYSNIDTLYDFTKTAGESIFIKDFEVTVDSISTTAFIGKDRLTMHLLGSKSYEGIGSDQGLLFPLFYNMLGEFHYLLCYYENGELLYHNDAFNSCNYNTTGVESSYHPNIEIYPNPVVDKIHIDNVEIDTKLTIYNSLGQLVSSQVLSSTTNAVLMPAIQGSFVIQLTSVNGEMYYSKLMIK